MADSLAAEISRLAEKIFLKRLSRCLQDGTSRCGRCKVAHSVWICDDGRDGERGAQASNSHIKEHLAIFVVNA